MFTWNNPGYILGIHFLQCHRRKCKEHSVSSKVKRIKLNQSYQQQPSETTTLEAQSSIVRSSPTYNLQTVSLYVKKHPLDVVKRFTKIPQQTFARFFFSSCQGPLFLKDMYNISLNRQVDFDWETVRDLPVGKLDGHMSNETKGPGLFWGYKGDKNLPSCVVYYIINHEIKNPYFSQPVFQWNP